MFNRTEAVNNLLALMRLQNSYIHELNKLIYAAATDLTLANNHEFTMFVDNFFEFAHYHYNSEGYSQAAQLVQIYHYILLERLLDSQVLVAAEQMELAIGHLEMVVREMQARFHPQIILLNQGILLMEETQLKIIESLEELLERSQPVPKLQN
ncbi:hypothetical protein SOV_16210 [Sporomusa ovata DSM 2662]|uniref:Uncharacterized protein n=1 Tax=Sporomusa ovata TaxID=2378 RepID=A0A0U1KVU4_9FIRM|nr:hypothetical protein [Sporomusa ovata]EQB29222.1 hypothetical protein SOV_1c09540 [Sporomusa ovata DSM 2662]CQR71259.1 hypothetical protein SpAn4DRAFT_3764 [Sporomusa ovata]